MCSANIVVIPLKCNFDIYTVTLSCGGDKNLCFLCAYVCSENLKRIMALEQKNVEGCEIEKKAVILGY